MKILEGWFLRHVADDNGGRCIQQNEQKKAGRRSSEQRNQSCRYFDSHSPFTSNQHNENVEVGAWSNQRVQYEKRKNQRDDESERISRKVQEKKLMRLVM